ncbi:MAG TPA: PAS domain S-box protein, partial [Lacibacter sp.]|nr:PAS domain S-box protein [Lacibacter sp.]
MRTTAIRILIVDDDEDDFFIISEYIRQIKDQKFTIDWCNSYQKAADKICGATYDLYFIDYLLGARTGVELIRESIENNCEEPFILLTGNGNSLVDRKAMESGAVDYLVKSELSAEKLERCIRYSLERASTMKMLRKSESKFRNIFEKSKDSLFIANENLLFSEVNDAACNLLNYSKEELYSKTLYELLADFASRKVIKQQLEGLGGLPDKEVEVRTKFGENKTCILTLSTEKNAAEVNYVQGIIHDITALKKTEKEKLMIEKMEVASRLVKVMAHEVRNPLNNIMLSTEQLEHLIDNEQSQICFNIIKRNSKRIDAIMAELLKPANNGELSLEKSSLQFIIEESIDAAIDRIKLRNIEVQKEYMEEIAWVMADREKLKIALLNIIINAVEAMSENGGQLNISLKKNEQHYV